MRNDFKTRLKELVTSLGYNGKARFAELSKGELSATVAKKIAKRVVSGEEEEDAIYSHADTNDEGTAKSKLVQKPANAPPGSVATQTRLLEYQPPDVQMMLSRFDARIANLEMHTHYAQVFNFEKMEMVSGSSEACDHLEIAGDGATDWPVEQ